MIPKPFLWNAIVNGEKKTGTIEKSIEWNTENGGISRCSANSNSYVGYTNILKYVKTLDLSESKIIAISNHAFAEMPIEQIILPSTLQSIDIFSFSGCTSLKNIKFSEGLTSIDWEAFNNCTSLTEIKLPNSVTSIDCMAFNGCTNLTKVVLGTGLKELLTHTYLGTTYKSSIFNGCKNLTEIELPCYIPTRNDVGIHSDTRLSKVTFKASTVNTTSSYYTISSSSWINLSVATVTEVVIDRSIKAIGSSAFTSCTALIDVYYTGTEEEWNAISIGTGNDNLLNATIHYNYKS